MRLKRDPVPFYSSAALITLMPVVGALALFQPVIVRDFIAWNRILICCISFSSFLLTVPFYMDVARISARARDRLNFIFAGVLLLQVLLIGVQYSRGVPPHFNFTSWFNGIVFGLMALFIYLFVGAFFWLTWRILAPWKNPGGEAPDPILLAAFRAGALAFSAGSIIGMLIGARESHLVGVRWGTPAIPFLNWNLAGGDLRVPHFLGLHGLQFFPLVAWISIRTGLRGRLLLPALIAYAVLLGLLLFGALQGQPLTAVFGYGSR